MIRKEEEKKRKETSKPKYKENLDIQKALKYKSFNEKWNNTKTVFVRPK